MNNEKGPIAETYNELQSLTELEKAVKKYHTEKCTTFSITKLSLQVYEIIFQNLIDLLSGAVLNIERNDVVGASAKMYWIKDLNFLLIQTTGLHTIAQDEKNIVQKNQRVHDDSVSKLEAVIKQFDNAFLKYINNESISLDNIMSSCTLAEPIYNMLHNYRIVSHEMTIWNNNLQLHFIPANTNYEEFIGLTHILQAVKEPNLTGDTFFKQFRCLHQVPELLAAEINDRLETTILQLRQSNLETCCFHLKIVNKLFDLVVASLRPLINNLSQNEYHKLRENLGLTSGSHSTNIHFHLFGDLYNTLSEEFVALHYESKHKYRFKVTKNNALKSVETELLTLRSSINNWRDLHLHLPRINLGGNKTKSLIGSSEAVEAAKKMKKNAHKKDKLNAIAALYYPPPPDTRSGLKEYLMSENSLDTILGNTLGTITQNRFKNVQDRHGVFSQPVQFQKPPKKII